MAESVVVEAGDGGLTRARVSGARAEAELYLQGGHLTRWQPRGAAPVIFLTPRGLRGRQGDPGRGPADLSLVRRPRH